MLAEVSNNVAINDESDISPSDPPASEDKPKVGADVENSYRQSEEKSEAVIDPFTDSKMVFDPNFADGKEFDKDKEGKGADLIARVGFALVTKTRKYTAGGFNRDQTADMENSEDYDADIIVNDVQSEPAEPDDDMEDE